ncbi:HlyD family type I secretion periplasmic adaptor subunit [uncultured Enterovirga sp.]|uniref:HlyD family type I secretion periplasmic adaptor subunit n=1 Tax=uncultured Enterovirga sp. TaxID=2026352 RepID=UPI0035CBA333
MILSAVEPPRDLYKPAIRRYLLGGLAATALLLGGVGGWAATTQIAGAVVASGSLVVESSVKKVQHPTGGVVGDLRVRDGDHVEAGAILLRLDDTQMRANLAIVTSALDELSARGARDEAERDARETIAFPEDLLQRAGRDPVVARLIDGETRLFRIRAESREGQKAQLRERAGQLDEEIRGLIGQAKAKEREIAFIKQELEGVRELWRKNLIQLPRLTALERDAVRIEGEYGALTAQTAQAKGKKAEIALQIIQIDSDLRSEVGKDLAEIRGKVSELSEKKVAAEDTLKRIDIRSPQSGTVHQLAVHTIGGVVTQSEPIMLIVPDADQLTAEVKIQPQDIDQLHPGQRAVIRFAAFNQRTTPEFSGTVKTISADTTADQKTGLTFYTVRISLSLEEIARAGDFRLVPGMPVETFIRTVDRTVLSYLMKPMSDQVQKAWRER